jgi:hypothetical protein
MNSKRKLYLIVLVLAIVLSLVASLSVQAASVPPVYVAGNPTCTDLGYAFGFRIDPPNAGTYSIDGINTVTVTTDGIYFDWSSTLGIDAVISKGGSNANVYVYDPPTESFGDTGLHSPINPNNGNPFGLSHIDFCYDYELTASKTAQTSYTRTYSWTITKSVDDDSHTGFTGDSFTSNYIVSVDQTATDSNFRIFGDITVNNPAPFTVSFGVSDTIVNVGNALVNCPAWEIGAGGSITCTYSIDVGGQVGSLNQATVTSNTAGVNGATAEIGFTWGDPTTLVGYPTINVTDSQHGSLGSASGDASFPYSRNFNCDDDAGENPNTATIVETGQSDDASVTVNCYELQVTKSADTSFTRTWDWDIIKSGDQTSLTISLGQQFLVNYTVTVSAESIDSDHAVNGGISVHNPAPIDATLNGVFDVVSPGIVGTVDCGVTFPYTLTAGGTLNCTYSADLPDASDRTNTATATLQNTPGGTTDFSGSAAVNFDDAEMNEVDECVSVSDDQHGALGTVCASESPHTFEYSHNIGPYTVCGTRTFVNVATFTTNDTGTTGSSSHSINVNVPCGTGCTLTQGYWKTHSSFGPAPYDDTWALLPNGANTTFFLSGRTWYQVFWTPPAGNAYYNLAHQYMAARLNILNGASTTPAVQSALAAATTFFNTYGPNATLTRQQRQQVLGWASTLDAYNNGVTGPGHCSE